MQSVIAVHTIPWFVWRLRSVAASVGGMVNKLFSARQLVVPNKGVESPFLGGPSRKNVVVPTLSIPEIKLAVGKPAPPPGRPPSTASARSRDHDGSNDDDDDAAAVPVFNRGDDSARVAQSIAGNQWLELAGATDPPSQRSPLLPRSQSRPGLSTAAELGPRGSSRDLNRRGSGSGLTGPDSGRASTATAAVPPVASASASADAIVAIDAPGDAPPSGRRRGRTGPLGAAGAGVVGSRFGLGGASPMSDQHIAVEVSSPGESTRLLSPMEAAMSRTGGSSPARSVRPAGRPRTTTVVKSSVVSPAALKAARLYTAKQQEGVLNDDA